MSGYVYAIASDNGLVKVGFTTDLRNRLSQLRANNVMALTPLGYARGTEEQEGELHSLASSEHVRGEWFRRGPVIEHLLSMLAPWPERRRIERRPKPPTAADEIIRRFGGRRAVAQMLGTSPDAVKQWKARGEIPGKWHLTLLREARARGIDLSPADLLREAA